MAQTDNRHRPSKYQVYTHANRLGMGLQDLGRQLRVIGDEQGAAQVLGWAQELGVMYDVNVTEKAD